MFDIFIVSLKDKTKEQTNKKRKQIKKVREIASGSKRLPHKPVNLRWDSQKEKKRAGTEVLVYFPSIPTAR